MAIFLTYDNEALQDGFGAQVLRILGVYSLARVTTCKYVHSPILQTIEEFAHNVKNQDELDNLTEEVNRFFFLPSDIPPSKYEKILTIRSLGLKQFLVLFAKYRWSQKSILVKILLPFGCTDKLPTINRRAVNVIRKNNLFTFQTHKKHEIVMHVRLGYGQNTKVAAHVRPRYLPVAYYIDLIKEIQKQDFKNSPITRVRVHTDVSEKVVTWKPTLKRLIQNMEFGENIEDGKVLVEPTNLGAEFNNLEGLEFEIRYCDEFFNTFLDMACADTLILSRSTFSYLAALFNKGNVVWPENHGHSKLRRWTSSSHFGIRNDFEMIPG